MRTNVAPTRRVPRLTHEGGRAAVIDAEQQLRRSVMACMLFEDTFYVDGVDIAERIQAEIKALLLGEPYDVGAKKVADIAYEARTKFKLRHAPLWLILGLVRAGNDSTLPMNVRNYARGEVADTLIATIQRPDELAEFIAMYWKDKKQPLSHQVKKGLAMAFTKFDRYALGKYANRDGQVKMRDVLFLTHAKPANDEQAALWKDLAENKLKAPEDTWEVQLSAGKDKKTAFTTLLAENKLGALALLRNLRNMIESGVDMNAIREGLDKMNIERVLPFRFITAARYAQQLEPELEKAMFRCVEDIPKLFGKTILLVDHSGSMDAAISSKSELLRADAANALAMLLREICQDVQVVVFGDQQYPIPPRRGFALRDVIMAQPWEGTRVGAAARYAALQGYDRCIIITDEQSADEVGKPLPGTMAYVINVAAYQNGVNYKDWIHLDGWSEACVDFIQQYERSDED